MCGVEISVWGKIILLNVNIGMLLSSIFPWLEVLILYYALMSGTDGVSEPHTVYSRRHPSNKRKSVEKALEPFIFYTASKIQNGYEARCTLLFERKFLVYLNL